MTIHTSQNVSLHNGATSAPASQDSERASNLPRQPQRLVPKSQALVHRRKLVHGGVSVTVSQNALLGTENFGVRYITNEYCHVGDHKSETLCITSAMTCCGTQHALFFVSFVA